MTPELVAAAALLQSILVRLLREGLIVRALVWPGLLAAGALLAVIALVGPLPDGRTVAVDDPRWEAPLRAAGFAVLLQDDPTEGLRTGDAEVALWGDDPVHLRSRARASDVLRVEAVVRDAAGAGWRLEPVVAATALRGAAAFGPVATLMGLLYTLYGAVLGAATLFRDRTEGVLEAELSLPVSAWVHPAVRLAATVVLLSSGLLGSLAVLDALMGFGEIARHWLHGTVAAGTAGALGLGLVAGATDDESFSGPLSQALSLSLGLLAAGAFLGGPLAWLPIASLLAPPSGPAAAVTASVLGGVVAVAAVNRAAGRG